MPYIDNRIHLFTEDQEKIFFFSQLNVFISKNVQLKIGIIKLALQKPKAITSCLLRAYKYHILLFARKESGVIDFEIVLVKKHSISLRE